MKRIAAVLAWIAYAGMVSPIAVFGDQPMVENKNNKVCDVALCQGGWLHGQVVDQEGHAVPQASVSILGGSNQTQLRADEQGRFQCQLGGGVDQVTAGGSCLAVRAWSENTAPPVATQSLLVVCDASVVRGQCDTCNTGMVPGPPMQGGYMMGPPAPCGDVGGPVCGPACGPAPGCGTAGGGFLGLVSNPWVVGAVVAAAIAIPLAVANDDDDNAS